MGDKHRLTRREIVRAIPLVTAGTVFQPVYGTPAYGGPPCVIRGTLKEAVTGREVAAKVRIAHYRSDETYLPAGAIKSMPRRAYPGVRHYFYARDRFEVVVPPGRYRVEAVRGICHEAVETSAELGPGMTRTLNIELPVLRDMAAAGWYSGNTHTHYQLDLDEDPDERLGLVPPAEALDVSVISYLIRNDLPYPTNRYPIGPLPQFSGNGTLVDMGEECRNNDIQGMDGGYGHCLFLNIPRLVEPVSTGVLSHDGKLPDFPTVSMLCAEAQKLGGTVIWCHNGRGLEMPVAVALGRVHAYNFADGQEADYERYYRLLNCGFRIPASTGTDWWEYDHNRVFVRLEGPFSYKSWLAGVRAGNTFVSNGPLMDFTVNGRGPGSTIHTQEVLNVRATAVSRIPFDRLELIQDGAVVAEQTAAGQKVAVIEREVPVMRGGWIAARCTGKTKTHGGYTVFAHTTPVYYRMEGTPYRSAQAAGAFIDEIEQSERIIRRKFRFNSDAEQALALGQFSAGKKAYIRLIEQAG